MKLIIYEIKRLEQDYNNCNIAHIKELILSDIRLLVQAVFLTNETI